MNFFKKIINFLKKKNINNHSKNSKNSKNNKSLYSYIFDNDSIWLFYKRYNFIEEEKKLKIKF